ncbi:MAG: FAD-dependent oxidoreductase [Syntrophales bacterium]|jgi:2,4-dienoyl-CoA reductase-like NADH-dependent reductase (Old Yellow Enzyme family)/thioredoxin reductase
MQQFKHLFTPIDIGTMRVKNRIVMLPLTTGFCELDETIGERLVNFFAARAKGGVGLIIVPFSPVHAGSPIEPGLYDDRFLPGVRKLADAVHAHGAKIAAQLITSYHVILTDGIAEVVGPSPVLNQMTRTVARPLTVPEIHYIVKEYGRAAHRARQGGFDAVEVLVGGGYLLNRFLSPITNKRKDEYGGSLENRMRIILEVIASVREAVGKDFPIGCRLNVAEQMEGGHTIEDSKEVVRILENAGIQMINVYTGWHESPVPTVQAVLPKGAFLHLAERIKGWVDIPVIAANRINDPVVAEKAIAEGKADMTGMARALLADPELPNKAREGRVEEIVPCLACSNCLTDILTTYKDWGTAASTSCSVNPLAGREAEYAIAPAKKSKKVFVIGGGPGGMEAAMTAAARGHKVTLYDRGNELGGKLLIASIPPYKNELQTLITSLASRARKAGVQIKLKHDAGPATIEKEKPDVLIMATGSSSLIPNIPGVAGPNVVLAEDVLTGAKTVSGNVLIVGGGMVGCETAEFLLERAKGVTQVTVIEMLSRMADNVSPTYRPFFLARLKKEGIKMETNTIVQEITREGVKVEQKGGAGFFKGNAVVLAVGFKSNLTLDEKTMTKIPEVYEIGDCAKPRMIKEAIEEGFAVGRKI